jgi:hypothetical protein
MSIYLFDMKGEVIAFRRTWTDSYVFDTQGHWIGWFPWDDNDAVDRDGHYLGTVVDDRLVRRNDWYSQCSVTPDDPGVAHPVGSPPTPHDFPNTFAYQDAQVRLLA